MTQASDVWDRLFAEGEPFADPTARPTNGSRHRGRRGAQQERSTKRRDIQGLRAVAVVAVVINHLTGHPVGGFVGVDVFFVISGFLITSHLLRDLDRTTGPARYVGDFYRRRIRRLFPAALLTILFTVAGAYAVLSAARARETLHDGFWAAIFGANWHFAAVGTNYFSAAAPPSPLQHYWSLSVEEQFYLLWPIGLFVLAVTFGRRIGKRAAGIVAASALTLGCLVFGAFQSVSSPTVAYFSTFTRGWELGLGALLACALPNLRMSRQVATAMSWFGLTLIALSLFITTGGHGFPVPGALLPCAGSALVIAATSNPSNFLLTNPASVFVGDVSYSVYLVHFPVIILLATRMPTGAGYDVTAVLITAALSCAMYGLVERPVLRSQFLRPASERNRSAAADDPVTTPNLVLAAGAALLMALGAFALSPSQQDVATARNAQINEALNRVDQHHHSAAPKPTGVTKHPTASKKPTRHRAPVVVPRGPKSVALAHAVQVALRATSWPSLTPPMTDVINGTPSPPRLEACGGAKLGPLSECEWGSPSAQHSFYLVGDSTSVAYTEAFIHMIDRLPNWNVRAAGGYGCNFGDQVLTDDGENQYAATCGARQKAVVADIKRTRPDVLVITNSSGRVDVTRAATRELEKVDRYVRHIVVLPAPPKGPDPHGCYESGSSPADCITQEDTADWSEWISLETIMAQQFHARLIDPESWFCAAGYCTPFADGIPTYYDSVHMTDAYSAHLAPVLLESLKRAGVI